MGKIFKSVIAALCFCMLFAASALADPTAVLDGRPLSFDQPPVVENGRTLVPLRAIFEAMGADVSWDQESQTATAVRGDTVVVLKLGSTTPTVNGQIQRLDVPAKVLNGRILAPPGSAAPLLCSAVWRNTMPLPFTAMPLPLPFPATPLLSNALVHLSPFEPAPTAIPPLPQALVFAVIENRPNRIERNFFVFDQLDCKNDLRGR